MISRKRQIVFWTIAILTVCLYLYGRYRVQDMEEKLNMITFVKTGEEALNVPQDNDNIQGVYWTELENRQVESTALGNCVETSVIALNGRSDVLFPNMPVIDEKSKNSCLISETLAYELFGGTDVTGLEITYKGKVYRVAGLIAQEEKLFLYEPSMDENIAYNRFSIRGSEQKAINVMEQELQMKYGEGKVLDYTMQKFFFEVCFLTDIEFPLDMIPDKWSNFEFWTERIKEKKEAQQFLIRVQKTTVDMEIREDIIFMKRLTEVLIIMIISLVGMRRAICIKRGKLR